jgi:hypothetical protein
MQGDEARKLAERAEEARAESGASWEYLQERALTKSAEAQKAGKEKLAQYWVWRMNEAAAYEAEDIEGAAACKAEAESIMAEIKRPTKQRHVSYGVLDVGDVSLALEELKARTIDLGLHPKVEKDRQGRLVFRLPENAVLWLYSDELGKKPFKHNSTLTVPKWVKDIGTHLRWRFAVERIW